MVNVFSKTSSLGLYPRATYAGEAGSPSLNVFIVVFLSDCLSVSEMTGITGQEYVDFCKI